MDITYRVTLMGEQARLVRLGLVFLWKNAVCGEIDNFELLLVNLGRFITGCGRPLVKGQAPIASSFGVLTRSLRAVLSRAGVMNVLCTRNLSLHLMESGGSSFMGWSSTGRACQRSGEFAREMKQLYLVLLYSLRVLSCPSLDGHSIAVGQIRVNNRGHCWAKFEQLTFGAVVLTLKATGCTCGFVTRRCCLTSCVNGSGMTTGHDVSTREDHAR
jgi:hypothetical protein